MQPIYLFNPSNNYNNNIYFSANPAQGIDITSPGNVSKKAAKLLKCMDIHISNLWRESRKNGINHIPNIIASDKIGNTLTIRPIYNYSDKKPLLLEFYTKKNSNMLTHQITINRNKPFDYRYEVLRQTPHGTATLKQYNSINENDPEMVNLVSSKIEEFFPSVIDNKILNEFFGINYKESLGLI